ncbi:hypothetical protein L3X38_037158 [Prunus dulcis]|uniref:Reverse transcriptase/retrotransposon-derived protein RNase H-like domain-containing protein n=1 Tax=Prunus dulcis TaxID=3755 RepID=A0AAD4YQ49_PRUDU|nr:hypothetical protein L3X38_037158 [Prunus dulcis]
MIQQQDKSCGVVTLSTLSLSLTQCSNIGKLQENFEDLSQDVHGELKNGLRESTCDFSMAYALSTPLHSLTKANQKFEWSRNHEESFQLLKQKITEAPVPALPNLHKPLEVEADASNYVMGAVLFQDGKPGAYPYEMFSGPVLNYPTYDMELYAMHQAMKH